MVPSPLIQVSDQTKLILLICMRNANCYINRSLCFGKTNYTDVRKN